MNKMHGVLLGITLLLSLVNTGCDPKVAASSEGIEVVSVKLEDWTNPTDNKVYVVALPTWKNSGKDAVRQVTFLASIKGDGVEQPKNDTQEPQFYGQAIEPGTTVEPKRIPEDGVVLGEKNQLKSLEPESIEMKAIASDKEYVPPIKKDV